MNPDDKNPDDKNPDGKNPDGKNPDGFLILRDHLRRIRARGSVSWAPGPAPAGVPCVNRWVGFG